MQSGGAATGSWCNSVHHVHAIRRINGLVLHSRLEFGLSLATDIERIALSEVRLLRDALGGNAGARSNLVRPYEPGLWSICSAMFTNEGEQRRAWQAFQDTLREAVTGFVVERPVGVQLFGHLWLCLTLNLDDATTVDVEGTPGPLLPRSPAEDRARVLAGLDTCAPLDRAVWLFAAVTGLSMESLAELTARSEGDVRMAHARASWVIHNALLE